jgi:hypothetical protein
MVNRRHALLQFSGPVQDCKERFADVVSRPLPNIPKLSDIF